MEDNNSFLYENRLKWVYLVGFFLILALPFLNLPPWFSPPDWGKTIAFRIVLSLIIFVFLWQVLFQKLNNNLSLIIKNILNKQSKVFLAFWLLISLLGVYFLATLFSQNPAFSFWGSPYRSGGLLNFAFCIIFAILAFLILQKSDWQKIWHFSIIIGIFVSFIAIFQQFGLFSKIVIPFSGRPPSTIGGPIFLGIYLLLLFFPTLFFGLKEKNLYKKLFYFFTLLLFFYVILNTGSRAAYIGLLIGILYFILCYPKKNRMTSVLKILFIILLIGGAYGVYYINTQPELPHYLQENKVLQGTLSRLSIRLALDDPRYSGWEISFEAMKERPILGYGPENFSIGFDKYYDPSLPYINKAWGSWWDRAHNFLFDIGVTAGIFAVIIYLSLFAALFWGLQKIKKKRSEDILIYHGLQATFIGYLVANFFSFDTSSTYLISFLLIAYSLYLIYDTNATNNQPPGTILDGLKKYRVVILVLLFIGLIWFIWAYNIKPFQVNKEINLARSQEKHGDYQGALIRLENIFSSHTYLDHYLRLNYIEIINKNLARSPTPLQESLTEKAIQTLKENIKIRPYYTRNWILLGNYTNILIEKGEIELKEEANTYFEKANELSPNRQEVFDGWIKIDYLTNDYLKAKEKAQKCIRLNEHFKECWWLLALSNIHLNEVEEAKENIKIATENYYLVMTESSLLQMAKAYSDIKNYEELCKVYYKLTKMKPSNAQYHAYLAACYKELGDFEKAKKEALKVLELMPETKKQIEEFLKELK